MELTREVRDRRVAIAKDVLLQMARRDVPLRLKTRNGYVSGKIDFELGRLQEIQPHVDAIQRQCEVCQRGAVLLSKSRLFDGVNGDTVLSISSARELSTSPHKIDKVLADTFDRLTLDRLEAVFEATPETLDGDELSHLEWDAVEAAADFGRLISGPAERVRVCMQSLIGHDGEFVLPALESGQEARP